LSKASPGWRAPALAALAGAGVALGQAPLGWWFVAFPALAGLFTLLADAASLRRAFGLGWMAGVGYFVLALFWIVEPFLVDPDRHAWMAPFALVGMVGGMALFWGAAAAFGYWLGARIGLALGFAASDLIRGVLFTGFPWALIGHIWIDTPVVQLATVAGAVGLTLLTTLAAAVIPRPRGAVIVAAGTLGAWLGGLWLMAQPIPAREVPVHLRLVQPNAAQHLKWDPDYARLFFQRLLDLSDPGDDPPDLVIWPETAVPFWLEPDHWGLAMIAGSTGGVPVALGIQRAEGRLYYNSLVLLDSDGQIGPIYDKHHLTPFGEYIPFGDLALRFGITGFAAQQGAGYSPGPGPALIDLGPAGRALPLICYEAIFPRNLRGTDRPDWLLQITNDGWFGQVSGPYQHLAQARLRAVEQGLPMIRVANTGVTAVIDARGRVLASLDLDRHGAIDTDLPGALGPTPYARAGDGPVILGLFVLSGALVLRRRRNRH
jgi:apolipoprotein N-acyltransferase